MKFVEKASEPAALRDWRLANKTTPQNLSYGSIPKAERDAIRASLLKEQGGLCAYTMWRIGSVDAGHIEHIHPQSQPPASQQISYANMVYCHPGAGAERCPFGAHRKDDVVVSAANFVSPLDGTCETRFVFRTNGAVEGRDTGDTTAQEAIETLCLNHKILKLAREAAIRELPIFKRRTVTASAAKKQAKMALERDRDGMFRPFAVALHQAWSRYADKQTAKEAALSAP